MAIEEIVELCGDDVTMLEILLWEQAFSSDDNQN